MRRSGSCALRACHSKADVEGEAKSVWFAMSCHITPATAVLATTRPASRCSPPRGLPCNSIYCGHVVVVVLGVAAAVYVHVPTRSMRPNQAWMPNNGCLSAYIYTHTHAHIYIRALQHRRAHSRSLLYMKMAASCLTRIRVSHPPTPSTTTWRSWVHPNTSYYIPLHIIYVALFVSAPMFPVLIT